MQEATYLILTALAEGSQHGYGIIADVTEISGGRVLLRPGTLYTTLDRAPVHRDVQPLLPHGAPARAPVARDLGTM